MTMNKKLKKTLQCTMCAVLSLGMVVCNSSFVEAKKIKKQESVFMSTRQQMVQYPRLLYRTG